MWKSRWEGRAISSRSQEDSFGTWVGLTDTAKPEGRIAATQLRSHRLSGVKSSLGSLLASSPVCGEPPLCGQPSGSSHLERGTTRAELSGFAASDGLGGAWLRPVREPTDLGRRPDCPLYLDGMLFVSDLEGACSPRWKAECGGLDFDE